MKAFLMYRDRDFDLQQIFPPHEEALTQDLELNTLFNAMALGDKVLFEVAKKAVLSSVSDLGHHPLSSRCSSGLPEQFFHCQGYLRYRSGID